MDATGAGDTFDAAFLDSWLDGRDLAECLRRAVLAGAFNVLASAAPPASPTDRNSLTVPVQLNRTHFDHPLLDPDPSRSHDQH